MTEGSTLEDTLHTEENHITVSFGSGIVGTVALTKIPINIKDAYQVMMPAIWEAFINDVTLEGGGFGLL